MIVFWGWEIDGWICYAFLLHGWTNVNNFSYKKDSEKKGENMKSRYAVYKPPWKKLSAK